LAGGIVDTIETNQLREGTPMDETVKEELLGDKNRRRYFRHVCDASIEGAFEYDRTDKWNVGLRSGYLKSEAIGQSRLRVLNMSEGGISLISRYPVAKNAVLFLKITTAFNTTIRAEARVVWRKRVKASTEQYAIGMEFIEISYSDMHSLKDLLRVIDRSPAK
jgi:hypothetical protein